MCGPTSKVIKTEEIEYKNYIIEVETNLAYPKRLNKIFFEIIAKTKEMKKYCKDLNNWYKYNYGDESKKPKNPDYKTGKYKCSRSIYTSDVTDKYLVKRIKTQEQIDEVIKLIKKKIDEIKWLN